MARLHGRGPSRGPAGPLARELLLAWLGFFAFLSADMLVRIVGIRGQFDAAFDAVGLVAIEGCRTITLLGAVWLAGSASRQAKRVPASGLLSLFVIFAGVWYAKEFAFTGFPGHVQEYLANRLIGAGIPIGVLAFVFGSPEWSAWIALGALLRLSVTWPRPLDSQRITESGARDRKGMMRSVALAGADIGAAFRSLAAQLVAKRLLGGRSLWPLVMIAGVMHSVLPWPAASWSMTVLFGGGVALAITNLRASFARATRRQRERVVWGVTAAVIAGSAFLVAGILSFGADIASAVIGVTVLSLSPIASVLALAMMTRRRPPAPGRWLRRALLAGTSSVTGALAYLFALTALPGPESPEIPVRELVALATSVVLVLVSAPRLREITDRLAPPLAR
jgi:hypothetical protein